MPCGPGQACPEGQQCDTRRSPPLCVTHVADAGPDGAPDAGGCGACSGATPVCDHDACRACRADAECASGVCTEYNGTCVPAGQAVFVAPGGSDAGTCTADAPCRTFAYALGQVDAMRSVVAVHAGMYTAAGEPALSMAPSVPLLVVSGPTLAPQGTTLTAVTSFEGTPAVVRLSSGTALVEGVVIQDGPNAGVRAIGQLTLSHVVVADGADDGVLATPSGSGPAGSPTVLHVWDSIIEGNASLGIDAQRGGLEVLRSTIATNRGGGISVQQGAVTVTSTIVVRNGTSSSIVGGIDVQHVSAEPISISFDTIADNQSRSATPAGLATDGPIAVGDVIYAGNTSGLSKDVFCSGCLASYSLFGANAPPSGGNLTADPAFVNPAILDYHITTASPARDAADPAATLGYDVDGEARPQGAARDIGADEIP